MSQNHSEKIIKFVSEVFRPQTESSLPDRRILAQGDACRAAIFPEAQSFPNEEQAWPLETGFRVRMQTQWLPGRQPLSRIHPGKK
jgi:hypothetical protein